MKVLFSCSLPFFLAHGGSQTLTEALMRELAHLGVEVEPARWWDENQTGDILHYIGRPSTLSLRLAQQKGMKVVFTDLLDQTASRSDSRLFLQRSFNRTLGVLLSKFTGQLNWETYREADAIFFSVPHERTVAQYLFDARAERTQVIPHGLEEEALSALSLPQPEEDYLISVATITERKNSVLLAEAARIAKVPILFLGKPYSDGDPYFLRFKALVDDKYVRYAGFVSREEKFQFLRGARGFALLSQFESGCIAVFEAAAAGLPLFLPALPWATKSYPEARDIHFTRIGYASEVAPVLAGFWQTAHRRPQTTFPISTWNDVARRYRAVYDELLHQPAATPL